MVSALSERIVLKDMTCPVIRLDKSRRKVKSVSFSISLFLHGLIFALVGVSFIKPPQFGIDKGSGSIEVNLVAAPSEVVEPVPVESPVEIKSEFVEKVIVKPVVKIIEQKVAPQTTGKDKATVKSTGGAISEAKPDYLKNPAPDYPESARRRGYEGTVLLTANVDKGGTPVKVEIEKSSGHVILDQAALKAVKNWKFRPAKLGSMPIESTVRVPVRFDLVSSK